MSYIYQTLNSLEMARILEADTFAGWTFDDACALTEHLEIMASESDQPMEFEPVLIRCEWSVYDSPLDAVLDICPDDAAGMCDDDAREYLSERTDYVEAYGGRVIVRAY